MALTVTGCGSDTEVPAANIAQPDAPAPIAQPENTGQGTENVSETVSRETGTEQTIPPPPPYRPAPDSAAGDRYRAIGTEPFWAVTVKGSALTLERPDRAPVRYAVSRHDDKRAIRYLGEGFSMTVTEGPCSDGMSDSVWSDRVAVAFGEGTLTGCGGVRDDQNER
ncbi:membrane-like protein [Sphingobium sp.]|uniref:membrane-like protein n=1 Tax=Sphingobium sp. TaxID=1912891 RepID=UPI0035C6C2D4